MPKPIVLKRKKEEAASTYWITVLKVLLSSIDEKTHPVWCFGDDRSCAQHMVFTDPESGKMFSVRVKPLKLDRT